ncbi:MAG TPA: hypothetical protein VK348_03895 [Planctomycetota bacterium]|nr:hypothetical protein [Planctomycetota bacterium]
MRTVSLVALLSCTVLCACAATTLPPGFARLALTAPEDQGVRLQLAGDTIVGATVALGPGALDARLRVVVDAVVPGTGVDNATFIGREWGPRGEGYRVERTYGTGVAQQFRSVLVDRDGTVLERTHTLALAEVPPAVLAAAAPIGVHDLQRLEIVSGPAVEECYRLLLHDRAGRVFVVETSLQGVLLRSSRLLVATVAVR